ncbi:MAG: response regulator transcription factor [Muribaculum sp.]|nr:response regulator transcription factor [Muribaculaceae bacterium]MCM1081571.1 response regulator transcription factor [Muribaculum sp.]
MPNGIDDIQNYSSETKHLEAEEKPKMLIADADLLLCELMKYNLESQGYSVDVYHSIDELRNLQCSSYTLIIADALSLGTDSVQLTSLLRNATGTSDTPLIFTAANATENVIISALEAGVDAFVRKPFSMREMIARINAVMRRYKKIPSATQPKTVCHAELSVDLQLREASIANTPLDLTMQECQLLGLLMLNHNKLYSAKEIISILWPGSKHIDDAHSYISQMFDSIRTQLGTYAFNIVADECFSYTYVE